MAVATDIATIICNMCFESCVGFRFPDVLAAIKYDAKITREELFRFCAAAKGKTKGSTQPFCFPTACAFAQRCYCRHSLISLACPLSSQLLTSILRLNATVLDGAGDFLCSHSFLSFAGTASRQLRHRLLLMLLCFAVPELLVV